jgi:hypothetical protein
MKELYLQKEGNFILKSIWYYLNYLNNFPNQTDTYSMANGSSDLQLDWLARQWNYLYLMYKSTISFDISLHCHVICCTVWWSYISCKSVAAYVEGLDAPAAW